MLRTAPGLLVAGVLLTLACGDGTGPGAGPQFSQEITIDELEDILAAGAARVEIEAPAGTPPLVATEVEAKGEDELADEEQIESPVADIDLADAGCEGTLTLALGGIQVQFSAAGTEFEGEDGDDLTCVEFVEAIENALAAGEQPAVEAERDPPAAPQAPGNATFFATELELNDESDEPEIEINVAAANLQACSTLSSPPAACLGVLKVLNVPFVIVEGTTELEAEVPELVGEVDFEGVVESADPGTSCSVGTVTLANGTVIQVVLGTEIDNESGDDDQLDNLCEVEDALGAGQIVEAEGEGVVTDDDPLTIVAIEVEFEVEEEPEDIAGEVDFEGVVASADPGASCTVGTVTLVGGTVIQVVLGTEIDDNSGDDDQLDDLCQVESALADETVEADGEGVVTATSPLTIVASEVKFEIQD